MTDKPKRKRGRPPRKPVLNDAGQLVTPVSGLPAAPINWAPACRACRTRTCADCRTETPHSLEVCRECGSANLSEPHKCPDTISKGTVASKVGTRQVVKCRVCGFGFSWVVKPAQN